MAKLPTVEQYQEQIKAEEEKVRTLLATEAGSVLLRYLERLYDGSLVSRSKTTGEVDDKATMINIGAREVYHHLRTLRAGQG